MSEGWRSIPGFLGYEASTLGRIRSLDCVLPSGRKRTGTVLRPQKNKQNGRNYVSLGRVAKRPASVWVAMAFLGHTPDGFSVVVDHKNEDPLDDRLDNLQLISQRGNIAKGYVGKKTSGLPTGVSATRRNKKPYMANLFVGGKYEFLGTFYTAEEAGAAYQQAVERITA